MDEDRLHFLISCVSYERADLAPHKASKEILAAFRALREERDRLDGERRMLRALAISLATSPWHLEDVEMRTRDEAICLVDGKIQEYRASRK